MSHTEQNTFSEHVIRDLRYGGGRFCYNYMFAFCTFWAIALFLAPAVAMGLEIIEYGHQTYGTGAFEITFYEWMQETLTRARGLLLIAFMTFTITVIAIEQCWASKFFWMVPNALVHLVLIGALV